jgi:DivIVA domain-containing protein
MAIFPEEISSKTFSVTYGRGYDRREVHEFLRAVAADYSEAIEKIALAADESMVAIEGVGEQVKSVLRTAKSSAENVLQSARKDADAIKSSAENVLQSARKDADAMLAESKRKADDMRRASATHLKKEHEEAFKRAKKTIEMAEKSAAELKHETERQRKALLDEAERRHDDLVRHENELVRRLSAVRSLADQMLGIAQGQARDNKAKSAAAARSGEDKGAVIDLRGDRSTAEAKSPSRRKETVKPASVRHRARSATDD